MRNRPDEPLPLARRDPLVVNEFHGEVLVYDPDSHDAYCLNPTSALVWKNCDGRTTITETAQLLGRELNVPIDNDVVWLALSQLEKAKLLQGQVEPPPGSRKISRRELTRRIGIAALLLPAITVLFVPPAVAVPATQSNPLLFTTVELHEGGSLFLLTQEHHPA